MFTGIVEEIGKIQNITSSKISISCKKILEGTKLGDSIAVNGVCLTVAQILSTGFYADISPETFRITTFDSLNAGDFVNLERAMCVNGRFGGHIVSGHIDGKGRCLECTKMSEFYSLKIQLPDNLTKYVVNKGSISINGISLTIANIEQNDITLAIIPHTYENTNLRYLPIGAFVNIETDILAKYVEKFLSASDNKSRIDVAFLRENGFG